ncbi:cytochrome P450 [Asanoa sp. WMMD1127]|uniref:cytochrome P450 n=1 Tax=Asanoa sp. WMMD1127 TaxID=3016107 RepID=UPI0024168D15|nr:cytochrome P450 [Asanoa sp. WMMD1127]MDG4820766.1 cytochrome P450 [Asanoa sp. WMMD1127]
MADQAVAGRPAPIDFDPFHPAHRADPYPVYRRLRERAPVFRTPRGHWLVSGYHDCQAVFRDPRFGHGTGAALRENTFRRPVTGRSLPFILLDPPEHTRLRSLVSRAFTPRRIERLAPRIQEIVDEMVDAMLEAGAADVIGDFGYPLPATVISEMLGVPAADREAVKELSHLVARGVDPDFNHTPEELRERNEAFAAFDEYFHELLAQRRQQPGDDLLSDLVAVRDNDERLSENELLTTCILLYVAGHETTMDLIGNGTLALLRNPAEHERWRADPGLATTAVEELLRYDPPTQMSRRTALADVRLGDHEIAAGDQVVLLRGAANRDPAAFADPERLDLGRADNRHISFDGGIHFCLGAALARLEGRIALGTLVRRAARIELDSDELTYRSNLIIRGLTALPVRLTA